jgi:hypothetical protein
MADAVATQTIQEDGKTAIFRFTNVSDGTGESAVNKIDVSGLSPDPMTGKVLYQRDHSVHLVLDCRHGR